MSCACFCDTEQCSFSQSFNWCSNSDPITFEYGLFYIVANSRAEVKGILHRHDGEEADVQKGTRRAT
jgi:hypothetical protein